jgi:hypothetical protein
LGISINKIFMIQRFDIFLHNFKKINLNFFENNFSEDDFFGAGLVGMGYSHRSYKKTIPNYKFIKG